MQAAHALKPEPRFVPVAQSGHHQSIDRVVDVVARLAGMSPMYLCRTGPRSHPRFNARAAVAVLAFEFCPRLSNVGCDDILRAGEGTSHYYRAIHAERCRMYPEYKHLYIKARIALLAAQ